MSKENLTEPGFERDLGLMCTNDLETMLQTGITSSEIRGSLLEILS